MIYLPAGGERKWINNRKRRSKMSCGCSKNVDRSKIMNNRFVTNKGLIERLVNFMKNKKK